MSDQAMQTPLEDLLADVPLGARLVVNDGPYSTAYIPVGRLCAEARKALLATTQGDAPPTAVAMQRALAQAVADLDATYTAAQEGKPLTISIGQFARLRQMRAALTSAPAEPEEVPIELWRGARKVTIYRDSVLRSWGVNIETEMMDGPRNAVSIQCAIDWLYAAPAAPAKTPPAAGAAQAVEASQPKLVVKLRSFPESNGKRNWTAMICREALWQGLAGNCGGITVEQGEYWNRVAYYAERTRFLLGQRDTEPNIRDYGDDIQMPDEWEGETRAALQASKPLADGEN